MILSQIVNLNFVRTYSTICLGWLKFFKKIVDIDLNFLYLILTMNKDLDNALMLIFGWIAFAMLVAFLNLVCVIGKLIFGS